MSLLECLLFDHQFSFYITSLYKHKDIISHFILRLAYSQTEDLRRWFIAQECHLLKFRVDQLRDEGKDLRREIPSHLIPSHIF